MIVSDYLSKKIRFLSFFLVILVVFTHNFFGNIPSEGTFSYIIQVTLSKGVCYIANPLFFIISGFLFYRKQEEPSFKSYKDMLIKKTRTLLIPYILTSVLVLLIYILLGINHYTNLLEVLKTWLIEPIPFQLWFLRYLMLLCLISPIIYYLLKKTKNIYIILIFLIWIFFYYKIDWALISITFFSVGAFFSLQEIKFPDQYKNNMLLIISIFLWISLSYIACIVLSDNIYLMCLIRNISIIAGLISIWMLYDYFHNSISRIINSDILSYSFFIYLFHVPLLLFVKKGIIHLIPNPYSTLGSNITYFLAPLLTIFLCLCVARILKTYIPAVYNIFTGNR